MVRDRFHTVRAHLQTRWFRAAASWRTTCPQCGTAVPSSFAARRDGGRASSILCAVNAPGSNRSTHQSMAASAFATDNRPAGDFGRQRGINLDTGLGVLDQASTRHDRGHQPIRIAPVANTSATLGNRSRNASPPSTDGRPRPSRRSRCSHLPRLPHPNCPGTIARARPTVGSPPGSNMSAVEANRRAAAAFSTRVHARPRQHQKCRRWR